MVSFFIRQRSLITLIFVIILIIIGLLYFIPLLNFGIIIASFIIVPIIQIIFAIGTYMILMNEVKKKAPEKLKDSKRIMFFSIFKF